MNTDQSVDRRTEYFYREGCICAEGWPVLSKPVTVTGAPRNRAERRAQRRGWQPTTKTYRRHIHSPECEAAWLRGEEHAQQ